MGSNTGKAVNSALSESSGNTEVLYESPVYRYERKYLISSLSRHEVESVVKFHPAVFSEVYSERRVNNIYFDSLVMTNFLENIEGVTDRRKIRIRWYGDLFGWIKKPVLEIKLKKGHLGTKIHYPLKPFELNQDTIITDIFESNFSIDDNLRFNLRSLQPTLLNSYCRKYYQSSNKHFRVTVDTDQTFIRIKQRDNTFLIRKKNEHQVILELKYHQTHDREARAVSAQFPFRVTKSSKYVSGVIQVYNLNGHN